MNSTQRLSVLLISMLAVFAAAQIAEHKITSLPKLQGNLGVQYSGYINVNSAHGRYLHYWFVQSSTNKPTDPVVLWLNGGPGCSSLDGLLYEHGPFKWAENDNDTTLIPNPYSWSNTAHMIYLEAPAGVGFSYSERSSDYTNPSDTQTAEDNFQFLLKFFEAYPQYAKNDFYIAGESYAGIYVPTLANRILLGNQRGESKIPLKGVLVGNGVANPEADGTFASLLPFMYGHGLFGYQQKKELDQYCTNPSSTKCRNLIYQLERALDDINIYDIYSPCFHQRPGILPYDTFKVSAFRFRPRPAMQVPCVDSTKADKYLNLREVKSAIHVKQDITWEICSETINRFYKRDMPDMIPIYHTLIANGIRILIYSGEADAAVPYTGSDYWTSQLLNRTVLSLWKPWMVDDQVAGFVTKYDGLTFMTVKGAGHMVPQTHPVEAAAMFTRFLQNKL